MEPLWKTPIRAFLSAICTVMGALFACLLFILLINAINESEEEVSQDYSMEILPNAEGVRKVLSDKAPVILQLELQGVIGEGDLTQHAIERLLVESREGHLKDNRVQGILLVINSPGGGMGDADGIYRAILHYKERYKVPVFAFVDGLCASGGFYVACAAHRIHATDTSLIGSVGVVTSPFVNFSKLMEKLGIDSLTPHAGKGKDALNPLRPWKTGEDENLQQIIDYYYISFVDLVTRHRPKISKDILVHTLGANIYPAAHSVEIGFIDKAGESREETLRALAAEANLEEGKYQVVRLESSRWVRQLLKGVLSW